MEDLLRLAIELNRPDFTVQVAFSGHVEWIEVKAWPGGWQHTCDCKKVDPLSIRLYSDENPNAIREACAWLRERSAEQEVNSNG